MLDMVLAAVEAGSESPINNPVSDAFYDLIPIVVTIAGGVAVAFRERLQEFNQKRQHEKNQPIYEALGELKAMVQEGLDDLRGRSGPSVEEIESALETLRAAGVDVADEST